MSTQHIINNREIGLTECGRLTAYHDVSDPTPWDVLSGSGVAIWDDDRYLEGYDTCSACQAAYNA